MPNKTACQKGWFTVNTSILKEPIYVKMSKEASLIFGALPWKSTLMKVKTGNCTCVAYYL